MGCSVGVWYELSNQMQKVRVPLMSRGIKSYELLGICIGVLLITTYFMRVTSEAWFFGYLKDTPNGYPVDMWCVLSDQMSWVWTLNTATSTFSVWSTCTVCVVGFCLMVYKLPLVLLVLKMIKTKNLLENSVCESQPFPDIKMEDHYCGRKLKFVH